MILPRASVPLFLLLAWTAQAQKRPAQFPPPAPAHAAPVPRGVSVPTVTSPAAPPGADPGFRELLQPIDFFAPPKVPNGKLSPLREIFGLVSSQGLPVKSAKEILDAAQQAMDSYRKSFQPKLALNANTDLIGSRSALGSERGLNYGLGLALEGDTAIGLSYGLDLPRLSAGSSTRSELDPASGATSRLTQKQGNGEIGANVAFRLLRGSVFVNGKAAEEREALRLRGEQLKFSDANLRAIQEAQTSYFDLMLKQMRILITERNLKQAQRLRADLEQMIKQGETERLAIVSADGQIAESETELLVAQMDLNDARQKLRELLALNPGDPDPVPDPNEARELPKLPVVQLGQAIEQAKKQRTDYQAALLEARQRDLAVRIAGGEALPDVSLRLRGASSASDEDALKAVSTAAAFGSTTWSTGLTFSMPLYNDKARDELGRARIEARKARTEVQKLEARIRKELAGSLLNLDIGKRRLQAAEAQRKLMQGKLEAEYEKFRVGESAVRNVVDAQAQLNTARVAEITARVEFIKLVTNLDILLGQNPAARAQETRG